MEPGNLVLSPSLIHNNLVSSGQTLAYVSNVKPNPQVVLIPVESLSTSLSFSQVKYKSEDEVLSINYVKVNNHSYLVLGFYQSLQIWTEDGSRVLGFINKEEITNDNSEVYFQGSCALEPLQSVVVGCSKGPIIVISADSDTPSSFQRKDFYSNKYKDPVATLCAYKHKVLAFHENGQGFLWNFQKAVDGIPIEGPKVAATVSTSIKKFGIVGFGNGEIRIFDLKEVVLFCSVWSHSRWITGICRHESRPIFATCSEDCTLAIWALRNGELELINNREIPNAVLTGVAICAEKVVAVAYDKLKLIIELMI